MNRKDVTDNIKFLHPFLLAIAPAIFLWGQNFGEVPVRDIAPAIGVLSLFGGVVLGAFWLLSRNIKKAALAASVSLVPVLFFGYIYDTLFFNPLFQLRWRWSVLVLAFIVVAFLYGIWRSKKELLVPNKILTAVVGVFVVVSLLQVGWGYVSYFKDRSFSDVEVAGSETVEQPRDIYYIILDGYSAPDVIRNVMGFEEIDTFVGSLQEKGFFIAKESRSNYPVTAMSLPSSLNIRFLEENKADLHKLHFQIAEDHFLKDFFQSRSYQYLHFGANAFTFFNRYADENINLGTLSPYQMFIWNNTIFKLAEKFIGVRHAQLAERFGFLDEQRLQWEREQFKLDKLAEVPATHTDPVFVLAHFLLPQGPYVFNADGSFLSEEEAETKTRIEKYLGQVEYVSREISAVVERLLEESDQDPIIIIQGDHGFAFGIVAADEPELMETLTFEPGQVEELVAPGVNYSFPILNAYHLPDGGDALLYDSISPVNTFRIILNYYFGEDLELLNDTIYIIDPNDPSRFIPWEP